MRHTHQEKRTKGYYEMNLIGPLDRCDKDSDWMALKSIEPERILDVVSRNVYRQERWFRQTQVLVYTLTQPPPYGVIARVLTFTRGPSSSEGYATAPASPADRAQEATALGLAKQALGWLNPF